MEISLTSKQVREQTAESPSPKRSPEYSREDKIPHIWANIPRQQAKEKRKKRKEEAALFISSPPTAVFQASVKSSPCLVFLMICSSLFQASVALFVWGFVLGTMRALHRAQNPRCDLTSIFSTTNWILWDIDKSSSYFKTEVTAGLKFGNVAGFHLSDVLISNGDFIPDDTHFYMRFHRWFWPLHSSSLHLPDNKGHRSLLKHISICIYEKQGCTVNRISALGREYGSKLEQRWGASCCRSQNVTTCSNTHTHTLVGSDSANIFPEC